jgi:hypothetical protein
LYTADRPSNRTSGTCNSPAPRTLASRGKPALLLYSSLLFSSDSGVIVDQSSHSEQIPLSTLLPPAASYIIRARLLTLTWRNRRHLVQ